MTFFIVKASLCITHVLLMLLVVMLLLLLLFLMLLLLLLLLFFFLPPPSGLTLRLRLLKQQTIFSLQRSASTILKIKALNGKIGMLKKSIKN